MGACGIFPAMNLFRSSSRRAQDRATEGHRVQVCALREIVARRAPGAIAAVAGGGPASLERLQRVLSDLDHDGPVILASEDPAGVPADYAPLPEAAAGEALGARRFHHLGDITQTLTRLSQLGIEPGVVLIDSAAQLSALVDAQDALTHPSDSTAPDIFIFGDDLFAGLDTSTPAYRRFLREALVTFSPFFSYFEQADREHVSPLYGILDVSVGDDVETVTTTGGTLAIAVTRQTTAIVRSLLARFGARSLRGRHFAIQGDDRAAHDIRSIAYGRIRGGGDKVELIPDAFFLISQGYQSLRAAIRAKGLPAWADREDTVFWRGTSTTGWYEARGVDGLVCVPRIALCLALRDTAGADAAIMKVWPDHAPNNGVAMDEAETWLRDRGILRPGIPVIDHARYRFLIDIDGVANAWGFFEKLLLGSCVLKIVSPFEEWFYPRLRPWRHFVPVKQDLSDLHERIEWCRDHQDEARRIGARGRAFARGHSYALALRIAWNAIRRSTSSDSLVVRTPALLPLQGGQAVPIDDSRRVRASGFHYGEAWGAWSAQTRTTVQFRTIPGQSFEHLSIEMLGFHGPTRQTYSVHCALDGMSLGEAVFNPAASHMTASFQLQRPAGGGAHRLVFTTADCPSPADLGLSSDDRPLGFGLCSLRLD